MQLWTLTFAPFSALCTRRQQQRLLYAQPADEHAASIDVVCVSQELQGEKAYLSTMP